MVTLHFLRFMKGIHQSQLDCLYPSPAVQSLVCSLLSASTSCWACCDQPKTPWRSCGVNVITWTPRRLKPKATGLFVQQFVQRSTNKHQIHDLLALSAGGLHCDSLHKWPLTWKLFPNHDVIIMTEIGELTSMSCPSCHSAWLSSAQISSRCYPRWQGRLDPYPLWWSPSSAWGLLIDPTGERIQCGAVITRSIFSNFPHNRQPIARPWGRDMGVSCE